MFGLSASDVNYNLPLGGSITTASDINHSSLLFTGPNSQPQWFFVTKLNKKYRSPDVPRFTQAERDAKVIEYADFQLAPGVTLKKLMDTSIQSSFLPLEEANLEHWSWGRMVCVGDSIHKMTPNVSYLFIHIPFAAVDRRTRKANIKQIKDRPRRKSSHRKRNCVNKLSDGTTFLHTQSIKEAHNLRSRACV